ncbi:acyl-CoA dehydrogenase family protein [Agromyces sp. Marseille-P2726]|uniref:acyl-CoA dehydrogenase family protein n=1 Tax=Agromyces sp. Marseille-P2726 TaxID=2709132 RepID=UPI00156FD46A|nr:acyl-CoA dehydrogenase family protein [Agromyces sp. Marseille-P2726]
MTLIDTPAIATGADFVERAKSIAHIIEAEAETSERETDVTDIAAEAMKEQGLFWMFVPRHYGGGQVDIVTGLEVIEEVSRADGSTGWVLMATSIGTRNSAFFLPKEGADDLFAGPTKAITAGYAAPLGTAVEVEGGVFGGAKRLQFASGSKFTTHLACTMRVLNEDGTPKMLDEKTPDIRAYIAPKDEIEMLGNWDVMGLVGTGSYDYALPERFLPEKYTLRSNFWTDPALPVVGSELNRGTIGFAGHIGVVLGLMKRALEEVANIVPGKKRQGYDTTVDKNQVFLKDFATADAKYQAVRSYALAVLAEAEESAHSLGEVSGELTSRVKQVTTWVHEVGTEVVNFAALWGASQTIRNPSALGRVLRDMSVARNHLAADPIGLIQSAGPILTSWQRAQ